ncbi:L-glutamate gamma-semialdehyde dehydrogenase [Polyangium sp. 15x6]|uniref:L-glutamate gamma-semialdehyde dehydrogenase n=1 Tax=Polyangium sp. 15x6 TaxID=3042687 RepID=UPI00249AE9FB|nr:L-glutamate gamma-semialdehyde dehydrogenase [Polyangium sp. 15x6]MDI3284005.1 L-glutamate gamma-semialdehyde dehydrogenase [Polyangium sp. 15x6]
MQAAIVNTPHPVNEPTRSYAPGTAERAELKAALARMSGETIEIPMVIGANNVFSGRLTEVRAPHKRSLLLARAHDGNRGDVEKAIEAALGASKMWSELPWTARAAVFLRAAELLATRYRPLLNAATMLGQSKTAHQAEIDAACELIDFLRFNVAYARQIATEQPESLPGTWNVMEPRPLEGFVFAATPFNFTAIAANLPAAPAIMGNTVVWKPSQNALLSAHWIMALFREAGLPDGVINLVMGDPAEVTTAALEHPSLAGVHFTGSTPVFRWMWRKIGENIDRYRTYPRLVGETGGKDFVFAHASADPTALAVALVRGAFEYQGQKCSAASRAYVPKSMWPALKERIVELTRMIRVGDVADFRNFMGAVIDGRAYARITSAVEEARKGGRARLICGGEWSDAEGFFIEPTVMETDDPKHTLMETELFGPVLTVWPYEDAKVDEALALCDETSPYALTGAVFARDRVFIEKASKALRRAAGNFYVNDKPTGAVVGQQPFGGGRASGTNDKAGSVLNLLRWTSPRVIKENFEPPRAVPYPFQSEP